MIDLIFPDGSKRQFDDGVTGRDVAASIAKSLEKKAVLVKLDGELRDLDRPLEKGGAFEIKVDMPRHYGKKVQAGLWSVKVVPHRA